MEVLTSYQRGKESLSETQVGEQTSKNWNDSNQYRKIEKNPKHRRTELSH